MVYLLFGICLCWQKDPQQITRAHTDEATKLAYSTGYEIGNLSGRPSTISYNGLKFQLGVTGVNNPPSDPVYAFLNLRRLYRPSNHVSMQALLDGSRTSMLHYYQHVNGDIDVTTSIPVRKDETTQQLREDLNKCFSDAGEAQMLGLKSSDALDDTNYKEILVDMSKVVDYICDSDLTDLIYTHWRYAPGGYGVAGGGWVTSFKSHDLPIAVIHPNYDVTRDRTGIALLGPVGLRGMESSKVLEALQSESGSGVEFYAISGSDNSRSALAFIDYGNGISLQDLHDRIDKFVAVMSKHQ